MSDYLPFSRPFDANGWEDSGYLQCRNAEEARAVAAYLNATGSRVKPKPSQSEVEYEAETIRLRKVFHEIDMRVCDFLSKSGNTRDAALPAWRKRVAGR